MGVSRQVPWKDALRCRSVVPEGAALTGLTRLGGRSQGRSDVADDQGHVTANPRPASQE